MQTFDSKNYLSSCTTESGVYRMIDEKEHVIYIGKAVNLKNRLSSYFVSTTSKKTAQMVKQIASIEVTVTASEVEALLLEKELISSFRPKYNILLRDDKSYPYLLVSADPFPRVCSFRGARSKKAGRFFGPYPSAVSLRRLVDLSQKIFKIRNCSNSFYANRSRPCLQYQIKRCTAPCVGHVTQSQYDENLNAFISILNGNIEVPLERLKKNMREQSAAEDYEKAAETRDSIIALQQLTEKQGVICEKGLADVIACIQGESDTIIYLIKVRDGKLSQPESYFPSNKLHLCESEVLKAFILEYYGGQKAQIPPKELILNIEPVDRHLIEDHFKAKLGRAVELKSNVLLDRKKWLNIALKSASATLVSRQGSYNRNIKRFDEFSNIIDLKTMELESIACFDISHTFGEETVASCVVFDRQGPKKASYRIYKIKEAKASDDYMAMREVITRYLTGKEDRASLIIVDGGKGQLSTALDVIKKLDVDIKVLGFAKDKSRKAGLEKLYSMDTVSGAAQTIEISPQSSAHHFVQHIRDEAHRFAISHHRKRRDKKRVGSKLESIPGVGPQKAKALLEHFGSVKQIKSASVEKIASVKGMSKKLAETVKKQLLES